MWPIVANLRAYIYGLYSTLTSTITTYYNNTISAISTGFSNAITNVGYFRSTNGYLEHSANGSSWTIVSQKYAKASTNVKYTWATTRQTTVANRFMKVFSFTPDFSGTVRISFQIQASADISGLYALSPGRYPYGFGVNSTYGPIEYSTVNGSITLLTDAIGTEYPVLSSTINMASIANTTGAGTALVTMTRDVSVQAGCPFVGIIHNPNGIATIQNITISYDIFAGVQTM